MLVKPEAVPGNLEGNNCFRPLAFTHSFTWHHVSDWPSGKRQNDPPATGHTAYTALQLADDMHALSLRIMRPVGSAADWFVSWPDRSRLAEKSSIAKDSFLCHLKRWPGPACLHEICCSAHSCHHEVIFDRRLS